MSLSRVTVCDGRNNADTAVCNPAVFAGESVRSVGISSHDHRALGCRRSLEYPTGREEIEGRRRRGITVATFYDVAKDAGRLRTTAQITIRLTCSYHADYF